MIDLQREQILTLGQAARWIGERFGRLPISSTSLWRWHTAGVRAADGSRVRLEVLETKPLRTSVEAVQRLFDRLGAIRAGVPLQRERTAADDAALERLERRLGPARKRQPA